MLSPPRPPHAIVVGGSGMLRAVCLALASQGRTVSVVARGNPALAALAAAASRLPGRIQPLPADYRDEQHLALAIRSAQVAHGPISLAVCWIHSDAARALAVIADMLSGPRPPARLFQVLGSGHQSPEYRWLLESIREQAPGIAWRDVVLGCRMSPEGPRWLDHAAIASGVLTAIETDSPHYLVGLHPVPASLREV